MCYLLTKHRYLGWVHSITGKLFFKKAKIHDTRKAYADVHHDSLPLLEKEAQSNKEQSLAHNDDVHENDKQSPAHDAHEQNRRFIFLCSTT